MSVGFLHQNVPHRADFTQLVVDWEPVAMVSRLVMVIGSRIMLMVTGSCMVVLVTGSRIAVMC